MPSSPAGRIVSLNCGRIEPFDLPRGLSSSAIDKRPVSGPVAVNTLGLAGDEQFERRYHGGPRKAVHLYASEDLDWWSAQLGRSLKPGFIGENVTTAGIDLNGLYAGDELHIGSVILRVTEPRDPCAKLAARIGDPNFKLRFGRALRTGIYCAVIKPGAMCSGDSIEMLPGSRSGLSIHEIVAAKYCREPESKISPR